MADQQREYALFSACGINCGLCPRYQTTAKSKCVGCGGLGFTNVRPSCGIITCCKKRGIEFCYSCDEYPCQKYYKPNDYDSFTTHLNMHSDLEKAKTLGLDFYKAELKEKMEIVEKLILNFNDGRKKSFFCLAVNLLDLKDVKDVMVEIEKIENSTLTLKEKSKIAVAIFQAKADERDISLKLRKK